MAKLIDGKAVAARVKNELKKEVAVLRERGIVPGLAVIIVGSHSASAVYVRNKEKAAHEIGILSRVITLEETATQQELLTLIDELNHDDAIHGILVQLPLPPQLDENELLRAICPEKDVDAFHPQSIGHVTIGDHGFLPCTPAGVMELLHSEGVSLAGKECVVIGRSNIVGKPMAMLLLHEDATVTICHSKTVDLPAVTRRADVLVSAVGRANFVTAEMVKPGAVVIDVGMNRNAEGKLCGDVDMASVEPVAGALTPVPGGVGPMTVAMLMKNTVLSAKEMEKRRKETNGL